MSDRLAARVAIVTGAVQGEGGLRNPPLSYKMSKAALNALTQSLAQSYAGVVIRVNAIMPGPVDTPMGVDAVARDYGGQSCQVG